MQVTGTIKVIKETEVISDKFSKREFVVTTVEQYPTDIIMEFHQISTALLDEFNVGDNVTVGINLRGREWKNPKGGNIRYFNTIQAWKIEKAEAVAEQPQTSPESAEDDLPF